jgi:hypothetical protein
MTIKYRGKVVELIDLMLCPVFTLQRCCINAIIHPYAVARVGLAREDV